MTTRQGGAELLLAAVGSLAALAAGLVACGGIAVVDPEHTSTGTAGSGGQSTTTTTSSAGATGGTGGTGGSLPQCPTEIQQSGG